MTTFFVSDGRVNALGADSSIRTLECAVAEKYRERARELRRKKEWKQTGAGALFMYGRQEAEDADIRPMIAGCACVPSSEKLVYSLNFEQGGGVYFANEGELDEHIHVNTTTRFYELDVNPAGIIAVSCAEGQTERHIMLIKPSENNLQTITDGDCTDGNPMWSRRDCHVLFYDSSGIGYDSHERFMGYGPRSIYRLNTETGELDEVLFHEKYNYTNPFEDANGNLYFIRRPYETERKGMSLTDILLAPFRVLRAIGGWLDFFSRRYTGEALNTAGANPAKANQKSEKELFIDGNLLEAAKNEKLNAAAGEKSPGYAPRSWELMVKSPDGSEKVLKKGVISYLVTQNGVIYSNGKYIISEEKSVKAHLATRLCGVWK